MNNLKKKVFLVTYVLFFNVNAFLRVLIQLYISATRYSDTKNRGENGKSTATKLARHPDDEAEKRTVINPLLHIPARCVLGQTFYILLTSILGPGERGTCYGLNGPEIESL